MRPSCGRIVPLGRRRVVEPGAQARSLAYALPLRLIWVLMGLLDLFAGLAKYRFDGILWFAPETLRHWIHLFWYQPRYRPPFGARLDELAPFLVAGAAFTLVFETTFWFWVLFDRACPLLAAAGLLFHSMTGLLLNIHFYNLQLLYPSLIELGRLATRFARAHRLPLSTTRAARSACEVRECYAHSRRTEPSNGMVPDAMLRSTQVAGPIPGSTPTGALRAAFRRCGLCCPSFGFRRCLSCVVSCSCGLQTRLRAGPIGRGPLGAASAAHSWRAQLPCSSSWSSTASGA